MQQRFPSDYYWILLHPLHHQSVLIAIQPIVLRFIWAAKQIIMNEQGEQMVAMDGKTGIVVCRSKDHTESATQCH